MDSWCVVYFKEQRVTSGPTVPVYSVRKVYGLCDSERAAITVGRSEYPDVELERDEFGRFADLGGTPFFSVHKIVRDRP